MTTANRRKFKGTLYDLLQAGDTITSAATNVDNAPRLNLRLRPPFADDTVALIADIRAKQAERAGKQADLGTLTQTQETAFKTLTGLTSQARETAKRAFKGNSVNLHDEFRVGQGTNAAGTILGDARIILASLQKADNAAAMAGKGWLTADTDKLDAAIGAAGSGVQFGTEGSGDELGQTAWLNKEADDLYDRLLDIQNAADLEWPDAVPADVAIRAKFLLGVFPYNKPTPPPAPAPAPATPKPNP